MSKSASRNTNILSLAQVREPGRVIFPFTAIVGQEDMKLSLILNVIDPLIGGVLMMGHRGTGKSTAVRALSRLLPPIFKVKGCQYGCDPDERAGPVYGLPSPARTGGDACPARPGPYRWWNSTEDRVCGSLSSPQSLSSFCRGGPLWPPAMDGATPWWRGTTEGPPYRSGRAGSFSQSIADY